MKDLITLIMFIFSGYASYQTLSSLGILDLPFSMLSWVFVTCVFSLGGMVVVNAAFGGDDDGKNK